MPIWQVALSGLASLDWFITAAILIAILLLLLLWYGASTPAQLEGCVG